MIFDVLLRLEPDPHQRDLSRGWAAELADPVWFLGRQWQMGEHQGEDASSPVTVELAPQVTPIGPATGQDGHDPATIPAQAILESEPGDWWTIGRRVRIGRAVAAQAQAHGITLPAQLTLADLPVPYDGLGGTGPDGRLLWLQRGALGLDESWFGTPGPPPAEPVDHWDPAELSYSADLPAGDTTLTISRHDGGDLDWFHADAVAPPTPSPAGDPIQLIPGRLHYPSAPLPRWWQIEDAQVSIGGEAPDRAALATLVLVDLIVNHSNDWFTFSLPARAGQIVTLAGATVIDSFGDRWPLSAPADWSLHATTGLDHGSIVLWNTARTPLTGPVVDDVVIGIDEDANLVWAVEQVVAGRTLATPTPPATPPASHGRRGRPADVLLSADDADPALLAPLCGGRGERPAPLRAGPRRRPLRPDAAAPAPADLRPARRPEGPAGRPRAPAGAGGDPGRGAAHPAPRHAGPRHHRGARAVDAAPARPPAGAADVRAALRRPAAGCPERVRTG